MIFRRKIIELEKRKKKSLKSEIEYKKFSVGKKWESRKRQISITL